MTVSNSCGHTHNISQKLISLSSKTHPDEMAYSYHSLNRGFTYFSSRLEATNPTCHFVPSFAQLLRKNSIRLPPHLSSLQTKRNG